MSEDRLFIKNEAEMERLGILLGERLEAGAVIAMEGDLGAGKTTLTRAIAKGLEIEDEITSPTFTIIHEYEEGRLPLYHFDVYRLEDEYEFHELGYEEYFYGEGVSVVEWADKIREFLPENTIFVKIEYGPGEEERFVSIK